MSEFMSLVKSPVGLTGQSLASIQLHPVGEKAEGTSGRGLPALSL